jgi:hypothetical protein
MFTLAIQTKNLSIKGKKGHSHPIPVMNQPVAGITTLQHSRLIFIHLFFVERIHKFIDMANHADLQAACGQPLYGMFDGR